MPPQLLFRQQNAFSLHIFFSLLSNIFSTKGPKLILQSIGWLDWGTGDEIFLFVQTSNIVSLARPFGFKRNVNVPKIYQLAEMGKLPNGKLQKGCTTTYALHIHIHVSRPCLICTSIFLILLLNVCDFNAAEFFSLGAKVMGVGGGELRGPLLLWILLGSTPGVKCYNCATSGFWRMTPWWGKRRLSSWGPGPGTWLFRYQAYRQDKITYTGRGFYSLRICVRLLSPFT